MQTQKTLEEIANELIEQLATLKDKLMVETIEGYQDHIAQIKHYTRRIKIKLALNSDDEKWKRANRIKRHHFDQIIQEHQEIYCNLYRIGIYLGLNYDKEDILTTPKISSDARTLIDFVATLNIYENYNKFHAEASQKEEALKKKGKTIIKPNN